MCFHGQKPRFKIPCLADFERQKLLLFHWYCNFISRYEIIETILPIFLSIANFRTSKNRVEFIAAFCIILTALYFPSEKNDLSFSALSLIILYYYANFSSLFVSNKRYQITRAYATTSSSTIRFTIIRKRRNSTYIQKLSRNDSSIPVASRIQHSLQLVLRILLAPCDKCASRRGIPLKQQAYECQERTFDESEKPYDQFKRIIHRVVSFQWNIAGISNFYGSCLTRQGIVSITFPQLQKQMRNSKLKFIS